MRFLSRKVLYFCNIDKQGCINCGSGSFSLQPVIDDQLSRQWELNSRLRRRFDEREGHCCQACHMSRRVRMLLWSLRRLSPSFQGLSILHLNQVNHLSPVLKAATVLVQTQFADGRAANATSDLPREDMTRLSFGANSFDLVIHSETLEHIVDYKTAISEATRVLKPGGFQVYTIPLICNRKTRQRITLQPDGKLLPLMPVSYHGCDQEFPVVWEFGGDFLDHCWPNIYQIHYDNYWKNPTVFTIIEQKAHV